MICAVLTLGTIAPGPDAVAQDEEGFISAVIHGIARRDLVVRFNGDSVYLPYRDVADMLRIIQRVSEDNDTVYGELPVGSPFWFLRSKQTFNRVYKTDTLAPGTIRLIDGEIYIEHEAFMRSLVIRSSFDLALLTLTISPEKKIPSVELKQAMRRYAALENDTEGEVAGASIDLRRSLFGAITMDWGATSSILSDRSSYAGHMNITTPLLFGTIGVRGRATLAENPLGRRIDTRIEGANWRLEIPEIPLMRSLTVGITPTIGSPSYSLGLGGSTQTGGIADYGSRTIAGSAEPGWFIELLDGPKLVGVTRVTEDRAYSFDVPLRSSRTVRTVRFRGPHGEKHTESHEFVLGGSLLPRGDINWNAGARYFTQLGKAAIAGSASASIGVHERVTLDIDGVLPSGHLSRLSLDSARFSLAARIAMFDATPVSLTLDPHSFRLGGSFSFAPIEDLPLKVRFDSVDVLEQTFDASISTRIAFGRFGVGAALKYINHWDRTGYEFSPSTSFSLLGINIAASARIARIERLDLVGENQTQDPVKRRMNLRASVSLPPILSFRVRFSGSYDMLTNELNEASTGFSLPLFRAINVGGSYAFRGTDWRRGTFSASVGMNLSMMRASSSASYGEGRLASYARAGGSMVVSSAGVDIVRENATSRVHLIVHGYNDKNLNGRFDGDDELLGPAESELFIENGGPLGNGTMYDAVPSLQNCVLSINPDQFAEFGLYPRRNEYRAAFQSGNAEVFYVPFAAGSDMFGSGTIRMQSGGRGHLAALLGLKVRLVSLDGVAEHTCEFINDGTYLVSGIAPGEYRIVIDERALKEVELRVAEMPATVVITKGLEEIPPITFEPDVIQSPIDPDGSTMVD